MSESYQYITVNERGFRIGKSHPRCKIPDDIVDKIRDRYENSKDEYGTRIHNGKERTLGVGYRKIAKEFGLPIYTVKGIIEYRRRFATYIITKKVKNGQTKFIQ